MKQVNLSKPDLLLKNRKKWVFNIQNIDLQEIERNGIYIYIYNNIASSIKGVKLLFSLLFCALWQCPNKPHRLVKLLLLYQTFQPSGVKSGVLFIFSLLFREAINKIYSHHYSQRGREWRLQI